MPSSPDAKPLPIGPDERRQAVVRPWEQEIVERAGGPRDGAIYQAAKGGCVLDVYDRLGILRPANVGGGPIGEAGGTNDRPDPGGST